tara:strand:+ start:17540 stop:19096 length:1557 start_codon:yes stop_codon:yes gene_type:complete
MKKLFTLLFFLLLCNTQIFAQGAFGPGGDLEPLGPYPIVKQKYIQGGLHVLTDTSLLASYLKDSVMVYQKSDSKFYRYQNGWQEVPTGPSLPFKVNETGDTIFSWGIQYCNGCEAFITGIKAGWTSNNGLLIGRTGSGGQGPYIYHDTRLDIVPFDRSKNNTLTIGSGKLRLGGGLTSADNHIPESFIEIDTTGIRVQVPYSGAYDFSATSGIYYDPSYFQGGNRLIDSLLANPYAFRISPDTIRDLKIDEKIAAYSPPVPNLQQVINVNGNIEFEDELEWVTDESIILLSTDFTQLTVLSAASISTGGIAADYFVANGGTDGLDFRNRAFFRNSSYDLVPPNDSNIVPFSIIKALISDSLEAYPTPTLAQVTASGATTATTVSFSGVTIEGATQLLNTVEFNGNWLDYTETALTDGQTLVSKSGQMTATNVAEIISHTEAINFPSISAGSFQSTTFTVTGVEVGDVIAMTPDKNAFTDNLQFQAWVNGANTVAVQAYNYTAGAIDPVSNSFYFKIIK